MIAARIQRQNLLVDASEAAFVFANELRFTRALAIARDLNRQRSIVRE